MTGLLRYDKKKGKFVEGRNIPYLFGPNRAIAVGTSVGSGVPGAWQVKDATAVWHLHVLYKEKGHGQGMSAGDRWYARRRQLESGGMINAWYWAVPSGTDVNVYRWNIAKQYAEDDPVKVGSFPLPKRQR